MIKQFAITLWTLFLFTLLNASFAFSTPVVSFPTGLQATAGNTIEVPITISGVSGSGVAGYALRIDFDTSVLSNPVVMDHGTLSQGNSNLNVFHPPSDGIGQLSVGIGFGFNPTADGTLIIIQFDVSSNFLSDTSLSFAGIDTKTKLFNAGFESITASFENGSLVPEVALNPKVFLPLNLSAWCNEQIEVPVMITNESNSTIGGYALRLTYDESKLSNPVTVSEGTLSEGNANIESIVNPNDGIGKYSVGIGFGFNANQSGTLIKIRFDVSSDFKDGTTIVGFAEKNSKTALLTSGFENIAADFSDGSLIASCEIKYQINGSLNFDYPLNAAIYVSAYTDTHYSEPVQEVSIGISGESKSVNFSLSLPTGSYYIQSFIDTNHDGQPDSEEAVFRRSDPIVVSEANLVIEDSMDLPWPYSSDAGIALDMNIDTTSYDDSLSGTDIENRAFASLNDQITIAVVGQNVSNLDTYQVKILFDPARMAYIKAVEDDSSKNIVNLLKKNGGETLFQPALESTGTVNISNSLINQNCDQAPEGSGVLALLTFKILDTEADNSLTPGNVFFNDCNDKMFQITQLVGGVTQPFLLCDFNKDKIVNYIDLGLLADHWLFRESQADWDSLYNLSPVPDIETGEQIINFMDLGELADCWLKETE